MPKVDDILGGKYRLVRRLGEGGMGVVYEAVHVEIGARAAIKFLHPVFAEDKASVKRFRREAQAAAAIGHQGIIAVTDIGISDDDYLYLVMELLQGQTLGEALRQAGQIEPPLAAYVCCQVLSALSAAHRAHILHRDLKPENVFLVDTGAAYPGVKILDFGIARALGDDEEQISRLTQAGIVLGTAEYMSPEQARGEDLDHRTDLYAVGVMLYETLTGQMPFQGSTPSNVLARVLTDQAASPRSLRPDLPEELDELILRALAKDPDERFGSAAELFHSLMSFVDERVSGQIAVPPADELVATNHEMALPVEQEASDDGTDLPDEHGATDREIPLPGIALDTAEAETEVYSHSAPTLTGVEARHPRRAFAAVLAFLVLGAALALAAVVTLRGGDAEPGGPSGPGGATQAPVAPAEVDGGPASAEPSGLTLLQSVDGAPSQEEPEAVELVGLPEGARVFVDDVEVQGRELRIGRDGQAVTLRIEAEGYQTYTRSLTSPAGGVLQIDLQRIDAGVSPGKRPGGKWRRWRPGRDAGQTPTKPPGYSPKVWPGQ